MIHSDQVGVECPQLGFASAAGSAVLLIRGPENGLQLLRNFWVFDGKLEDFPRGPVTLKMTKNLVEVLLNDGNLRRGKHPKFMDRLFLIC